MKEYDFVVVGSGIAGLTFALKAAKHGSVAVVTKRRGADTNTAWAQGGIACVTSSEDSFELHLRDTLEAGAGLCHEAAARTIITEGPARIRELMQLGLHFDEREVEGHRELDLGREGGHSKRRVLHVHDMTGLEIEKTLLRELGRTERVDLLENHMAVDLITAGKLGFATEDRCLGVYVLDEKTATVETIRTDRLVLATGGCGKVYLYTTNPDVATGDGVAMAWRAGAKWRTRSAIRAVVRERSRVRTEGRFSWHQQVLSTRPERRSVNAERRGVPEPDARGHDARSVKPGTQWKAVEW
jgi:L-aspartate oxidase